MRVVDLKSGTGHSGISPEQTRQLLIYAHLVAKSSGRVPDDAVIQDVRGREESFEVEARQVQGLVEDADSAIKFFNEMLAKGTVLARPSAEVCQWCPFRVVCTEYWANRTEDWPRLDVRGVIEDWVGSESIRLVLATKIARSSSFRLLITAGVKPQVGDEVVVLDLERAGPATGRMRWNSRLRSGSEI